ncbi:aspartic peptidase domain-containing protein [Mycena belliarum]|uniref:Aspartic peptidase domain-containing protein n=1 Tax=Mycena belliarum TaxID=1033014 RepID=A0AAD6XM83_9AGAR|nr:aspartic peptidase domain-containing protein [Mycena belliae]
MLLPASLLTFILLGDFACALRLHFEGRRIPQEQRELRRRGSLAGSSPLENSADLQYTANITVGGVPFEVIIDTGSADLWVAGSVPSGQATGKAATISYASGSASGPVKTSDLLFGGYTVPKQAFIEVPPDTAHPIGQGLIGLGPSSGSVIYQAFASEDEGNTVLDSIFIQNTSTPNFITFILGRLNDPSSTFPGDLSVGEILPNYTAVVNQPKLPSTDVSIGNSANQHFQILLDANGFIGPDGSSIPITSKVGSTSNKKQATVVIDTGFSLPQVPSSVAKAIYGQFSGAELVNDTAVGQIWIVPCKQEVNVTLKFGGKSYPVHPLDSTIDPKIFGLSARTNSAGVNSCLGLFQPFSFDTGSNPTYDMIFGMAFLRNVYTLIDFGDYVADSKNKADPYIQFLSITDPADAHNDFVQSRLNGVDTTNNIFNSNNTTIDDGNPKKFNKLYYIIGASVLGGLLLIALGILLCRRRKSSQQGVYRPLHLPAPGATGAPPMYQQGPMYQQPYGANTYNPDRPYDPPTERVPYHNPWEGRRQ